MTHPERPEGQLARRHFVRNAGMAAAGVLAAPVVGLAGAEAATPDGRAAAALVPNGTNDTTAIQTALDATGLAELGRGTFKVSQLRLRTGQTLLMSMQTVLQGITGARPVELVAVFDADDVRIEGGILTGTGSAGCRGIGIFGSRRVLVRGTRAINMAAPAGAGGHGFYVGTSYTRVSEAVVLDGVSAAGNVGAGILVTAVNRLDVVDAEIVDTGGTGPGISLAPAGVLDMVSQVTVRGCDLSRNHYGLRAVAATTGKFGPIAVIGNKVQSNRVKGIDAVTRHQDGLLVDGNVVVANAGDGVSVDLAGSGVRIVDNEIRDNGAAGVRLRTSQRWEVRGNQIVRQRGPGVAVHPGTATGTGENYGLISHNQLWDNSVAVPLAEGAVRIEGTTGQKPSVSVVANWYGNFVSPATQRCGVLNVGAFDRTTVMCQNNRMTGHSEIVNI